MNPIAQGLALGYSAQKILGFISKAFPAIVPKINKARQQGHTLEQILGFVSKTMDTDNPKGMSQPEIYAANQKKQEILTKHGLTALAGAAGSFALSRALPAGLRQMFGAAGSNQANINQQPNFQGQQQPQLQQPNIQQGLNLQPGIGAVQQTAANIQNQPQALNQTQKPPVNPVNASNISQPQQVTQPEGIINPKQYLEKLGIKDKVDDLLKRGNTPEQAAAVLGMKGGIGKVRGEIDPELLENIDAYSKESKSIELPKAEQLKEEKPTIAKGDLTASPQGIGEIKELRNGKAIIDIDGKKHQVEEKSLLKPPKEAAVEALELIKGFTPEQQRSTHHMLNAYDEGEKKGFFVFHNGSAYVVDDISPEEYKELSEEVEAAKTTGETIIGKWASGEGSRGAGYNKVIKGVRERKVVPALKKNFRKLKVGYNLLAEWQKLLGEHEKDLRSQGNQTSE